MAWSLSEACAATGLSTDCQETCCLRWKVHTCVFVYLGSFALLLGPPPPAQLWVCSACKSIRRHTQTNTHYTIHPSIPVLPAPLPADTKPPCTQASRTRSTADGMNYLLESHPKASWHLVFFEGEIFMGPALASADCCVFARKWRLTTSTGEWISLLDEVWLLSHVLSAQTCRLWLC